MTTTNELSARMQFKNLLKRVLQGGAIAFILVTAFLLILGWGHLGLWILLPMATVTAAGAFGGLIVFLTDPTRYLGGWQKIIANIVCVMLYLPMCWASLIVALALLGMWD